MVKSDNVVPCKYVSASPLAQDELETTTQDERGKNR